MERLETGSFLPKPTLVCAPFVGSKSGALSLTKITPPLHTSDTIQGAYAHYQKKYEAINSTFITTINLFDEIFFHPDKSVLEDYLASLEIDFGSIPDVEVSIKSKAEQYYVSLKFPTPESLISKKGELFEAHNRCSPSRTLNAAEMAIAACGITRDEKCDILRNPTAFAAQPIPSDDPSDPRFAEFSRLFREYMKVPKLEPNRILILSTSIGGGHLSYARTLEQSLKKREFEVLVLNVEEFAKDLFKEMDVRSQGTPIELRDVFGEKTKAENPLLTQILSQTAIFLDSYQPSNWELLLDRIYSFAPSIIFSTAFHCPNECVRISSLLQVPLNIITTDHKIVATLDFHCRGFDVNYFVPGENPEDLLIEDHRNGEMYHYKFDRRLVPSRGIHTFGNGADLSYFREYTEAERSSLKEAYGIAPHEKMILVTCGSRPNTDSILNACKRLIDLKTQEEIGYEYKVIVICGENPYLIETIGNLSDKFLPLSSVTQEQMAQCFAISDCILGKPGGGMTAQVEASGAFMVADRMYEWEIPNIRYLERKELGKAVLASTKEGDNFTDCIKEGFEKTQLRRSTGYERPKKIEDHMEKILSIATHSGLLATGT